MNATALKATLQLFASFYVQAHLRERCLHEAIKHPEKLDQRIRSGELFDEKLLSKPTYLPTSGTYLRFSLPYGFSTMAWEDFHGYATDVRGELWIDSGELIISNDAQWFWSATETSPTMYYYSKRPATF